MDESFTQWRDGKGTPLQNNSRWSSLVISDSEDEPSISMKQTKERDRIIESSESNNDESSDVQNSRRSTENKVYSHRSARQSNSSKHRSESSDDDLPVNGANDSSSSDKKYVHKRLNKKNVINDSNDDVSLELDESEEQSANNSGTSNSADASDSTNNNTSEDSASELDENSTDPRSRSFDKGNGDVRRRKTGTKSKQNAPRSVAKHVKNSSLYDDDSEEEIVPQPAECAESLDTSSTSDNLDNNSSKRTGQRHANEENITPMYVAPSKSPVGNGNHWSKDNEEDCLIISDTSETKNVGKSRTEPIQPISASTQSLVISSNSEDDAVVMSCIRKEVGVGNVDPFVAQKRALLTCNIEQVQNQLMKSKMLLNTANIDMLPDKGEKLRRSANAHEAELRKLSAELESLPMYNSPAKVKTEPKFPSAPLPFNKLPTTEETKELGAKALARNQIEQALTVERLKDLHGSLKDCPGEDQRAEDPKGLKVPLMPHQQHALAWLLWRENQKPHGGILADDMGLGKTLTMISLILATVTNRHDEDDDTEDNDEWVHRTKSVRPSGGTLVVCPASLLDQWAGEITKRVKRGLLSVELYHGANRETVARRLAKYDVVITTYTLIGRHYQTSILSKIYWQRVILDEAHIVRNHKSMASEGVCFLSARNRWALTGTPIQNKELDLYALLKFLRCTPFDDLRVWKRWVDNKNAAGHERLATVMKSLMLRRTKIELQGKGALQALPDKNLEVIEIKLDPEEQLVYEKVLVFSRTLFAQFLHQRAQKNHMFELHAGKFDAPSFLKKPKDTQFTKVQNQLLARHADVKAHEILVLLLRLRQICCHPALIHAMLDQEDLAGNDLVDDKGVSVDVMSGIANLKLEDNENMDPNEMGVDQRVVQNLLTSANPVFKPERQSSKMRMVLAKVEEILDKGDKIVIVSQWTSMLETVRSHLDAIGAANYSILSGNVPIKSRQQIVEAFNEVGFGPNILLLSLTAGGVGLNLVGGNHLLLLDIHWNPQLEAQAQDRIYRVGQTKSVYIYKFICIDTVEQRIKLLQDAKLDLAQGVLTGHSAAASKLSLDDLRSLFSL